MFRMTAGAFALFLQTTASFADASDLCLTAARSAAAQYNIPVPIMVSLTLTETGRSKNGTLRPWPWAVNHAGQGYWHDTPDQAISFANRQIALGDRNFDIGCFQINHRWHGENFQSLAHSFDPMENALYAAEFLSELHMESGDWIVAAAQYHSRTPSVAGQYRERFETILASIAEAPATPAPKPVQWFGTTGTAGLGSLVLLQGTN